MTYGEQYLINFYPTFELISHNLLNRFKRVAQNILGGVYHEVTHWSWIDLVEKGLGPNYLI